MTYYGLSLNVANLSGGMRINFTVSCVVELIGYGAAVFLLDQFGRKLLHAGSMLLAGLACLLTIFTVMFAGNGNLSPVPIDRWCLYLLNTSNRVVVCTTMSL